MRQTRGYAAGQDGERRTERGGLGHSVSLGPVLRRRIKNTRLHRLSPGDSAAGETPSLGTLTLRQQTVPRHNPVARLAFILSHH